MPDDEVTVADLRARVRAFVDERDWQPFHTPKNLVMSIAIEAAELMERFQWLTPEEAAVAVKDPAERADISDELADVLIYCLSLSNALGLDVSSAVLGKLQINKDRYPADEFRSRFRRPGREKADQD
jgi:NTP pyrophosphatase (non-canonical NTP hydrolase)